MTLTIIGWVCWVCAVISMFSGVKTSKTLYLGIAAFFLAAAFIILSI